jgi:hypothetical protein
MMFRWRRTLKLPETRLESVHIYAHPTRAKLSHKQQSRAKAADTNRGPCLQAPLQHSSQSANLASILPNITHRSFVFASSCVSPTYYRGSTSAARRALAKMIHIDHRIRNPYQTYLLSHDSLMQLTAHCNLG